MTRNLRNRSYDFQPVDTYEVAPHRYTWHGFNYDFREAKDYREWLAGVPYKAGEVIYVEYDGEARKAIITDVFFERDQFGDRREKYRVHLANKTGNRFAKNWFYTHPGYVQRGYKLAGLAPDVPRE